MLLSKGATCALGRGLRQGLVFHRQFAAAGFMIRPPNKFLKDVNDEGIDFRTRQKLLRTQKREYLNAVQDIGAHPYPHIRQEQLKPKDRRRMMYNKSVARAVNSKMQSLVELIEFKKKRDMQ